jgi:hypothetical protein
VPCGFQPCHVQARRRTPRRDAHRLMLRIPKARVDSTALEPYFSGHSARLTSTGEHVLIDVGSETEEPEYDEQSQGSLAALSRLRSELMRGDLRPAYLAWLLAFSTDELDDDAEEPPVPPGLTRLTAAQEATVEFLRIDIDLLAAGASVSCLEALAAPAARGAEGAREAHARTGRFARGCRNLRSARGALARALARRELDLRAQMPQACGGSCVR